MSFHSIYAVLLCLCLYVCALCICICQCVLSKSSSHYSLHLLRPQFALKDLFPPKKSIIAAYTVHKRITAIDRLTGRESSWGLNPGQGLKVTKERWEQEIGSSTRKNKSLFHTIWTALRTHKQSTMHRVNTVYLHIWECAT